MSDNWQCTTELGFNAGKSLFKACITLAQEFQSMEKRVLTLCRIIVEMPADKLPPSLLQKQNKDSRPLQDFFFKGNSSTTSCNIDLNKTKQISYLNCIMHDKMVARVICVMCVPPHGYPLLLAKHFEQYQFVIIKFIIILNILYSNIYQ